MLRLQQVHDMPVNRCASLETELVPFLKQAPVQNVEQHLIICSGRVWLSILARRRGAAATAIDAALLTRRSLPSSYQLSGTLSMTISGTDFLDISTKAQSEIRLLP